MPTELRRVLLLSPSWPPGPVANGIVTYIDNLRQGLERLGIASTVMSVADSPSGDALSVSGSFGRSSALARLAVRACWRILPERAEFAVPALDALVALRNAERASPFELCEMEEAWGFPDVVRRGIKAPVVVRLHGPWFVNGLARGARQDATFARRVRREGKAITSAAGISAPSRDILDRVRQHYAITLPDAVVIPNPGPVIEDKSLWSARSAEAGHVVFVGRFDRHKGGDVMLDAFARLCERRADVRLTLAGPDDGVTDEHGKRWRFREYAEKRLPPERMSRVMLLGHVDQARLRELRIRASVVVSASRYDNFPMAVLEALAQGCPVVCSDSGGSPEMVAHERSGLIFRAGDAASLADRLETLLDRPELAATLAERGLADYRARYLPDTVAVTTAEWYAEVLARARRGRP